MTSGFDVAHVGFWHKELHYENDLLCISAKSKFRYMCVSFQACPWLSVLTAAP